MPGLDTKMSTMHDVNNFFGSRTLIWISKNKVICQGVSHGTIICLKPSLSANNRSGRLKSLQITIFYSALSNLSVVVFSTVRGFSGMIIRPRNAMLGEKCVIAREILRKFVRYISPQTSHHGPQSF